MLFSSVIKQAWKVRLPSRTTRTRAVPLQGEVTFSPQLDPVAGAAHTCPQGWLQNYGLACSDVARGEMEEKTHTGSSSALVQRVSFTSGRAAVGDATVGDAHGSAWAPS